VQSAERDLQNGIRASFEAKILVSVKMFQYIRNITKSTFILNTIIYTNCSASFDIDTSSTQTKAKF